jgi:predicted deacylase
LKGVESVLAEFGMHPTAQVAWPGWRTVVDGTEEKTWLRADTGGIVDMHHDRGALVYKNDRICSITNPFKTDHEVVRAPFTGLLVGVLENPVVYPGNPLCHLVELPEKTLEALTRERDLGRSGATAGDHVTTP